MMEAHFLVIIDRWGKCRLSTVPLKTGNDGTTAGLPQALGCDKWFCSKTIQLVASATELSSYIRYALYTSTKDSGITRSSWLCSRI